uniref:Uncharacterized protein n=1 Tax=Castor canadensis TaxID=51338 RepID=A0A8C0XD06_CASCN
ELMFSSDFSKMEFSSILNLNIHNTKLFEHQHDTKSGKFHTVKLCFIYKII